MKTAFPQDTIAAISTPRGKGGISVIRISGPDAFSVVQKISEIKKLLTDQPGHTMLFGRIMDDQRLVDEVLFSVFKAPNSYTGENVVEISCHGNEFITSQILELLLRHCRLANPGEFTLRAYLNNKMDLTRAEAVGNLLMAQTLQAQKASLMQLEGKLEKKIKSILRKITDLRIKFELSIDFVEDEVPLFDQDQLLTDLLKIKESLVELEKSGRDGLIVQDGLKISLAGAPNVGKSSLFNRFLETERAIVTPIPGTTRDYLEEAVSLNGYLVRFFDTAGIREASDSVEKIGIERSRQMISQADYVLALYSPDVEKEDETYLYQIAPEKIIRVLNKSDLLTDKERQKYQSEGWILCSTLNPEGLNPLTEKLISLFGDMDEEISGGVISNARQLSAVRKALESIDQAERSFRHESGVEFIAFDLKICSEALEEIIGRVTSDDLLNQIFDNFCIGK